MAPAILALATLIMASAATITSSPRGVAIWRCDGVLGRLDIQPGEFAADRAIGIDAAKHQIGIGEGRAGHCPARSRPGPGREPALSGPTSRKATGIDMGDGAATSTDGGDLDHRRAHDHAKINGGLGGKGGRAIGDQRHVKRCATKIRCDDIVKACRLWQWPLPQSHLPQGPDKRCAHRETAGCGGGHDTAIGLDNME